MRAYCVTLTLWPATRLPGETTTLSPAFNPSTTSTDSPSLRPMTTLRSTALPSLTRKTFWMPAKVTTAEAGIMTADDLVLVRISDGHAQHVQMTNEYLDRVATSLRAAGLAVETRAIVGGTRPGAVSHQLAEAASAANVDAIVMSTHGRGGVTGWFLGSVADELVRSVDGVKRPETRARNLEAAMERLRHPG